MGELGLHCVFFTLLCLVAVTGSPPRSRRQSSMSMSTSSFGVSLYKILAFGNQDNIIYSPLSVYTGLAMALLGAGGDTEQELKTALRVQPGQNVHSDLHGLLTSMMVIEPESNLTLRLANALYYDPVSVRISDSYAASMRGYYGVEPRPFQRPNPEQAINLWVEEVTEGAITDFLPPDYITSDIVLMLLNAAFFEASWKTMFDPSSTRNASFITVSGTVKQVTTMYKMGRFSVKNVPEARSRVLELPYKGGNYSLFIILPNTWNGFTEMERRLNGQILENAVNFMPPAERYRVYLPKFSLRMRKNLNEPLDRLGLHAMFLSHRANFSGMVSGGPQLFVSKTLHEAMIEVTESGTKAAAVTSLSLSPRSMATFAARHSFMFVLRDKTKGINLFMGRVADPTQA